MSESTANHSESISETNNDGVTLFDPQEEKLKDQVEDSMYASPLLWVPLSCLVAIFFAIGNNIVSLLAHYGFKAREIQAPG